MQYGEIHYNESSAGHAAPGSHADLVKHDGVARDQRADVAGCRPVAVERPQLLRDVLDRTLSRQRMMATLVGLFGAVALVLAVLGLYGVMAHAASQRTPEIGIRLPEGGTASVIPALCAMRVDPMIALRRT